MGASTSTLQPTGEGGGGVAVQLDVPGGGPHPPSGRRPSHRPSLASVLLSHKSQSVPQPPPELTDAHKQLLADSWRRLEDDIASVGVITFISLFETHPDVQEVFMPFKGIALDDLKHSKQLKAHALRVMAFVQKAVARLHEQDKLQNLLEELGRKHVTYGAKKDYVDLIGPQFIQAIRPSLEKEWTPELQEAWERLFQFISFYMKASMEKEKDKRH